MMAAVDFGRGAPVEESVIGALAQSLAHAGPQWALVALAGVAFFAKVWPSLARRIERADEREDRREERKAEESRLREEHDRELTALQGQWVEQQRRSNAAMEASNAVTEGVRAQLAALNDNLRDSKEHSRRMGETMHTVASQVQDIHDHIIKEGN